MPSKKNTNFSILSNTSLQILVGKDTFSNQLLYLPEKSLYQNILITGTIGTGKTSSAMYPFTKQLMDYEATNSQKKLAMLILDVKGNYYHKVLEFAANSFRQDDVIVIELNGKYKYNPLDKPNLKPSILANRLKTILLLFSQNNSEAYWLDKASQILEESIKLCRLYNNGYVTFEELHKLITQPDYYLEKITILHKNFIQNLLNANQIYDLLSSLTFFQKEFLSLDQRTLSILKSEITRITNCFVSDYEVLHTFSPTKQELNFFGFEEVLKTGKIVVLNMNIHEYSYLSKIIAAYLKLDFQTEVMKRLSEDPSCNFRSCCFISDEYSEYCTSTDANFFAQSREAKCINIVATQSYTSLLNTLHDTSSVNVITQNLINKLWFRSDDIFTIETAQKQIGKEDKEKLSKSIAENARETNFSYFTRSLHSKNSNITETLSSSFYFDYVYDTHFFTQSLENFYCLGFLSDGLKIIPPHKIRLFPYFDNSF
ncbi:MAG: type IV secretion system DNA-binding domain-containing protein [Clostridia bacterium]|nr:type IV secretion system DNA-binding domain-containing protein [Clostridia bacterium]